MSTSEVPPIGRRIRAVRARQGLTVRGLAREIGVSASLISQIETGKSRPSVSTLYAITTALGISVEELFAVPDTAGGGALADLSLPVEAATLRAVTADRLPEPEPPQGSAETSRAHLLERDRERRVGPVVRPGRREKLTLDSGVTWELLGQVPGLHVDFLRVTYEPGGTSSSSGYLMRHSGTEFGYLISGALVLTLGFDEHRLGPGDAISFESSTPHGYRNDGTEPAIGVWFVLDQPS